MNVARGFVATIGPMCGGAAMALILTGNPMGFWFLAAQLVLLAVMTYLTVDR